MAEASVPIPLTIAVLDAAEPDPDFKRTGAEDSFEEHRSHAPGCPVSDLDFAVDDLPCDPESDF